MKTEKILRLLKVAPTAILFIVCLSCSESASVDINDSSNLQSSAMSEDNEIPYVMVEELPMFPGGDNALLKYIAENTKYPDAAKKNNVQGRVVVRFCVSSKGNVNRPSILQSVSEELDNEALKVVASLPKFEPGRQGGKAVAVWYMIPITFALQ